MSNIGARTFPCNSVVIPARNEESTIGRVVRSVLRQCPDGEELEVLVVDDGSSDRTVAEAKEAGAIVLVSNQEGKKGNPAAARNRGARMAVGNTLVFLDADCVPAEGWLQALRDAHDAGEVIVGGSIGLPSGLSWMARCDYYCGWYLVHPQRPSGYVPHHPPPNLSVRRDAFLKTSGFSEQPPLEYTNEERAWQAELRHAGHKIYFEPKAVVYHHNHPGLGNLLRRNYRWGYTAIESKSQTGSARLSWLYRYPRLLVACSAPYALAHTAFILVCWMRAGVFEPILMFPTVLISRFAYAAGMVIGGIRWLRSLKETSWIDSPLEGGQVMSPHRSTNDGMQDVSSTESLTVCAVICTRDRPQQLQRALHSLLAQTRPPAEILVIDNAPENDATLTIVRNEFPTVHYVRESIPGLDFARNRALAEASQEIVAFLDDDAVAGPGWVDATARVFSESPRIAICTGKVEALTLESEGQRLFEANGGFARGDERIRLPVEMPQCLHGMPVPLIAWSISVGSGCSLAVRRQTIIEIGRFDEALDMGPALPGGGDLDIIWRTLSAGYEVVYEPKVQARHEHRYEVEDVIHQILEHNRSLIAVLTKAVVSAQGTQRLGVIMFLLWRLVKPGVRLVRRLLGRDPLPASALLRLWWQCWRGLGTYARTRRLAQLLPKEETS